MSHPKKRRQKLARVISISLIATSIIASAAIGAGVYFSQNQKTDNKPPQNPQPIQTNESTDKLDNSNLQNSSFVSNYDINKINKQRRDNKELRVGHWNILNQGGTNELKNEALARIILKHGFDVIALTEINSKKDKQTQEQADLPVKSIVDIMNKYTIDNNSNLWSYKISENIFSIGSETQVERVGFIYNSSVLKTIDSGYEFKNNDGSDVLVNQHFISDQSDASQKIAYSRPPFAYKFQTLDDKFNFTLVAAHFDSPGASTNNSKQDFEFVDKQNNINQKQGSKELNEAYNMDVVLKLIDQKDGSNDDLIFMGDTNIRKNNEDGAFSSLLSMNYKSLLKDSSLNSETSLSRTTNKWSQPYDKIFVSSSIRSSQGYRYNLWDATVDNTLLSDDWKIQFLRERYTIKEGDGQSASKKANYTLEQAKEVLKNWNQLDDAIQQATWMISDHTLVYTDIKIDENDIANEK